jgi:hypothetical protein
MIRKIFGKKVTPIKGWQPGDPAENGKGLEQPMPRVCANPVQRVPGTFQVEEVRSAIEATIQRDGYLALTMPERVFINVYYGMSFFVAGPEHGWITTSPRDWVTVVAGLSSMGEPVAAGFVEEMVKFRERNPQNQDHESDQADADAERYHEGLIDIMKRWSKVEFDRTQVLQRYLERDYWTLLLR